MLRASLFAMSVTLVSGLAMAAPAMAGPYHHPHHRPAVSASVGVPSGVAARVQRPVVRPLRPRPVFIGYPQPVFPFYGSGRTLIIGDGGREPAPRNVTVTLNPVPVVMGIRRAPEAAPVIYRIADGRDGYRMRHQQRRRMAPSAGVHHLQPDTTTPRIVVVRVGHRD